MSRTSPTTPRSTDRVFRCLSDATRRRCIALLRDRDGPVPETELAALLAAESTAGTVADVDRAERDRVRVALVHTHLPKLAEADLVSWDRDECTVELLEDSVATDGRFQAPPDADPGEWDEVLSALAASRRRTAVSVLADSDGPVDRRELVSRVLARESGTASAAVADDEVDDAEVEFCHVHLPKLRRAGLVTVADDRVEAAESRIFESALLAMRVAPVTAPIAVGPAD